MDYNFLDLVDMDKLQRLIDDIYSATGISADIVDPNGKILLKTEGVTQDKQLSYSSYEAASGRTNPDPHFSKLVLRAVQCEGEAIHYECTNGIYTAIAPICVQGKCVAFVYKSQFLFSPPEPEYFREQAIIMGLPESQLIEAALQLPILPKDRIDRFMRFVAYISELFTEAKYCHIKLTEQKNRASHRYQELMAKHQELMATYEEIGDMEEELYNRKYKIEHQEGALKVSQERIRYLAYYDIVTGLPNRLNIAEHITHWLSVAKKENKKGVLFFLDIDNFKVINDTFGHGFGDKVLKQLGEKLGEINGDNSHVGRFGGDEFIFVRFDIKDKKDIRETINSILQIFNYPWIIDGYEIYPTVSIGVTIFPDDGDTAEILLKNADIAMYEAKKYGKNTFEFFEESMNDRVIQRMEMDRDLRNALDRKEFSLVYQPQVNSRTGRVEAVEALIRWNHPKHGFIPPSNFIPFAEETGLIIAIGEWVLRTACKQNKEWQDKGYNPVRISVNISPLQLRRWNFVSLIQNILEEIELDPSYLELEITENNLMESMEDNIKVLERLYQMGVRIALDDFGTGYSSLNYLQRLPINNMKIDRFFVEDITNDIDKRYIAEVIIGLAHRMNLKVTAEGVETEEQLRMLVNQKCDIIQGFIFSRPLPPEEIVGILKQGRMNLTKFI